jgi:transglutaminase-like putative cysteine protease
VISLRYAAAVFILAAATFAEAAPEWVTAAARKAAPQYPSSTKAVILYDSTDLTIGDGTIVTHRRRVARLLTAAGRDLTEVDIALDRDTTLRGLRAWSITNGVEKEVSERDAIETAAFGDVYDDLRVKILRIPGAQAGSIIAYEYEESGRPAAMETSWRFQGDVPVVETTLALTLTEGWSYEAKWFLREPAAASLVSGRGTWTIRDVPAIDDEPRKPSLGAIAGRLSLRFGVNPRRSWSDVGRWYSQLADPRCASSPQLEAKVRALIAPEPSPLDRVRALAAFMQQQVRYVAVEIGIGGYQPHSAKDVFSNRYGDCKDKVTLLRTMLRHAGIESYYVLVNATPGVVDPEFPSASPFNHAIIAVHLPPEASLSDVHSSLRHARLGTLMFFDPTSDVTPVGYLPEYLQQSRGLLVTADGGELVELPAAPPAANQLRRRAVLLLDEKGTLSGNVEEIRTGSIAAELRATLRPLKASDRIGVIESAAAGHVAGLNARNVRIDHLDEIGTDLLVRYEIAASGYATRTAGLVLVRPRVLGQKEETIVDASHRKYAYVTDGPSLQTDEFEITLPNSLQLDELPAPASVSNDFLTYSSSSHAGEGKLVFQRQYEMRAFSVPASMLPELNRAFSKIDADERASAVFAEKP